MKKAAVPSILVVVVLVAVAIIAEAQQPARVPRIGYLTNAPLSVISINRDVFSQGLRELGYIEGKNIIFEWRSGEQSRERQRAMAAELVRLMLLLPVVRETFALPRKQPQPFRLSW
jgi:putative tryptophan/tyrosine transport system substrate-binding protein